MRDDVGLIADLLALVDVRKGDSWYDACCRDCYYEPWHGEDRYGDAPADNRNQSTEAVARCECVCHEARARLGLEEDDRLALALSNPPVDPFDPKGCAERDGG